MDYPRPRVPCRGTLSGDPVGRPCRETLSETLLVDPVGDPVGRPCRETLSGDPIGRLAHNWWAAWCSVTWASPTLRSTGCRV